MSENTEKMFYKQAIVCIQRESRSKFKTIQARCQPLVGLSTCAGVSILRSAQDMELLLHLFNNVHVSQYALF